MSLINFTEATNGNTANASDINTPLNTIYDEFNGNISSVNLASNAVTTAKLADSSVTPAKWTNPYCFRAYNSSSTTIADNSFTKVELQAEDYDISSDFDSTTNYRYTAPVNGIYHFDARVSFGNMSSPVLVVPALYKNGVEDVRGVATDGGNNNGWIVSTDIELTSGDYIELYMYQNSAGSEPTTTGHKETFMTGHLVHPT